MPLYSNTFGELTVQPGSGSIDENFQAFVPYLMVDTTAVNDYQNFGYFNVATNSSLVAVADINAITPLIAVGNQNDGASATAEIAIVTSDYDPTTQTPTLTLGMPSPNFAVPQFTTVTPGDACWLQSNGRALQLATGYDDDILILTNFNNMGVSSERMRFKPSGAMYMNTKVSGLYNPIVESPVYGTSEPAFGYNTIGNYGMLGTFTGATVPALSSATYDLDVYIDGDTSPTQVSVALLNTDSWTSIASKLQTALRSASGDNETVTIDSGKIKITSANYNGDIPYATTLDSPVDGSVGVSGYAEISNSGSYGTFPSAIVPALSAATYDLDITVDGVFYQTSFALLDTDTWAQIAGKIQTAIRTATGSTETVAISGGKIKVTSASTGVSSTVLIVAGTTGSDGGDFLTAVDSLPYLISSIYISNGTAGSGGGDLLTAIAALPTTGTIALDSTVSNLFCITPTGATTINISTVPVGQRITFVVTTSGTSSYNITFGTNFKSTGTLATGTSSGKVFTIEFYSDGTNFNEISRTAAM